MSLIGLLQALDYSMVDVDLFVYSHRGELMGEIPPQVNLLPEIPEYAQIERPMVDVLKEAGIANYTIWNVGNELFGYYECEKGIDFAARTQAQSEIVDRWNEYMKDVMTMEMDPETGAQPKLQRMFLME